MTLSRRHRAGSRRNKKRKTVGSFWSDAPVTCAYLMYGAARGRGPQLVHVAGCCEDKGRTYGRKP